MFFPYGETEIRYLSEKDPALGAVIASVGPVQREVNPNIFASLVSSIISQQISGKAAATIEARLLERAGELEPAALSGLEQEEIQSCGMSMRKAGYILSLSRSAHAGEIDLEALREMPDAEVIKILVKLPGIGRWTAEMLLIFSLCRPDIITYDDLGLRKGMQLVYGLNEISRAEFAERAAVYSPYSTVASLYLWHISGGGRPR